ncbi:hypothetical protein [Mechercharimyces sp. CAU 1602]|uniref:hypothetical protein n=1 Tax=Mechercharimyces sp. CAU 1602 TaxID=2973933 RepID=UPI002161ECB0|nr:hypothetical protein [Mechercharimyces sp. CAU 1602]MCS1352714.1 hypothetical protein [Mechercharimyces sp. CAU 1602]
MTKAIVYTSFDGDNMLYIDMFRDFVIMKGRISLNPTHALGYYVSTVEHNNNKKNAMQDCCSIELLCDEFWVFDEAGSGAINDLPEGVILELLVWLKNKKNPSIRFLSIDAIVKALSNRDFSYEGELKRVTEDLIQKELENIYFNDILKHLPDFNALRRPVFIDLPSSKFKYVDWVKAYTFRKQRVPIVPQSIIPFSVYQVLGKTEQYINDITVLLERVNDKWIVREFDEASEEFQTITYKEVGIPKYRNSKEWALTSRELERR